MISPLSWRAAEDLRGASARPRLLQAIADLRRDILAFRAVLRLSRRFDADQPRVPAGNPDGGQWTSGGSSAAQEMTRRRPFGMASPAQQARLVAARARAYAAVARVMERDPTWRRPESLTATVEGEIVHHEAVAKAAEARYLELQRMGVGPGAFARDSMPTSRPGRDFSVAERGEIDRIGTLHGCHTCGTREPGTASGHFVPDHQMPTRWNPLGREQRLYPQCLSCSLHQGGWVNHLRWRSMK